MKPERHEVDFGLLRRRRVIEEFRRSRPTGALRPPSPGTVADEAAAAFDRLGRALRDLSTSARDPSRLLAAFEPIDSLAESWPEDALPRPYRNSGRRISRMVTAFRQAMELFVEALYDETESAVQEHAKEGQRLLDEIGISDHAGSESGWPGLAERALGRLGAAPLELTRVDEELARSLSGRTPSDYPPGIGLQLFVLDAMVDDLFDRDNVDRLRGKFTEALERQPALLVLFSSKEWRSEAVRAGRLSASGWRSLGRALDDEPDDVEVISALLEVVGTNREAVLRFVLSTLLALSGRSWASLQADRAGSVLKAADALFPELELSQIDSALRHIGAHKAFDVGDDEVTVRLDGGEIVRYASADFLDRCLQALEVSAAAQYALFAWVSRQGIEWPTSPIERQRDREDALAFILGASSLTVIELTWRTGAIDIEVAGPARPWGPLVAAISGVIPDDVSILVLQGADDTGQYRVEADLGPTRAFLLRDPEASFDEESRLLLAALQGITCDGESQIPADWWPGIMGHAAGWRRGDSVRAQVIRLLAIRPLVEAQQDAAVTSDFHALLAAARAGQLVGAERHADAREAMTASSALGLGIGVEHIP